MFRNLFLLILLTGTVQSLFAQNVDSDTYKGMKFRNIGPALTSGRIADIAIHPENESVWYVAVGSGGVWKTMNSGTTWKPIFDKQTSYSIGCITIDPNNSSRIYVGTGENVGGRHVGFGDGLYKSEDNGKTWKNIGLKASEHISKIIVHPTNPDIIWVAVQGPLWSKGGERGLYKTSDGGKTWKRTLGDAEWTGATDLLIDPKNPDVLYAATWQRHRTVAMYLGGGPGSGIHKSTDGGESWQKMTEGIPKSNLGKIGLALSPFDSNIIYAAIELDRTEGGVFISKNQGLSWSKQSNTVSGGTGPHYYQELYASPHQNGRLYLMNNYVMISDDHGKTFYQMNEKNKHVDSHAIAFRKSDPNYVLFGTDGGLYESFDLTDKWKYVNNLPITQYYKVAVDDSEPFYKIYGGTQDNGSHGGPSRTLNEAGIRNADWWITLGADGHQSAIEPGNPDITYGEFQEGRLWRVDQTTGETVFIQPQALKGDPAERFNWDSPILVSPHNPKRIYFASYRVWKSENRGDDWVPVSGDLSRNQNRIELPIMGKQQSWDNAWDVKAMSQYNTITSLAESPKQEGLLYAGTDDGIIQVSENGGSSWTKVELGSIKGIPSTAFVNDVRADLFDANTVYAALDNHKYGDFKPYLIKSTNKGKSWVSINGNLPSRLITWRLVQDHIKKDLLFAATEYGIYFSTNGGVKWIQLKDGLPTISFRDLTIQRRENDLVYASFGRGFYILDDISPLREFDESKANSDVALFPVKKAYWYVQKSGMYGQGDNDYKADNPPFGAIFTYYMPDSLKSLTDLRKEKDKKSPSFPGWDALDNERRQDGPEILLTIKDSSGKVINTIKGTNKKGFNRVNWDLTFPDMSGELLKKKVQNEWMKKEFMATPGSYSVSLSKRVDGVKTDLGTVQNFEVVSLRDGALPRAPYEDVIAFRNKYFDFQQNLTATKLALAKDLQIINAMKNALDKAPSPAEGLSAKIAKTRADLMDLDEQLTGNKVKAEIGESSAPTPQNGDFIGTVALRSSTHGPTGTHKAALDLAIERLGEIKGALQAIDTQTLPALKTELKQAGAPWIEGMGMN